MDRSVPSRRRFLGAAGTAIGLGLAGCSGSGEPTAEGDETTASDSGGRDATQRSENLSEGSYTVEVTHDDEWEGYIQTSDGSRSRDGTGSKTFDAPGDLSIVTATVQKATDSTAELTVRLRKGGRVVRETARP